MKSDNTAQEYWLSHLGDAGGYNGWIFSHVEPHLGEKILEVGCGAGTFTMRLARQGRSVLAVDLDPAFIETAKQRTSGCPGLEFLRADLNRDQLPGGFDPIVFLDVLEHLPDDLAVLSTLRNSLLPGGKLIIKVPAMPWLFNSMDEAIGHYRRYGRAPLREVISNAGFEDITIWPFNTTLLIYAVRFEMTGLLSHRVFDSRRNDGHSQSRSRASR